MDRNIGNRLNEQINRSPELLRDYVHGIETSSGTVALMVRKIFVLEQQIEGLKQLFLKDGKTPIK